MCCKEVDRSAQRNLWQQSSQGSKDQLTRIGWLSSTTVGIKPVTEKYGKRLSPEAVQIARREELEFMDKLEVLKEVLVEQCWSETSAKPM